MKQRESWIDIAKGLCLIAVILGHIDAELFGFVYSFHLTTFFILSGYTLHPTSINVDYLKQKFHRLMLPYFLTCAAVISMDMINSFILAKDFTTQTITHILYIGIVRTFFGAGGNLNFGSIGTIPGIGAIWFLPAMFFALIITQLVLRINSKHLQIFTAISMFIFAALFSRIIWLPFSLLASFYAVIFLLLGYYIHKLQLLEKLRFIHYEVLFSIFILGCFFKIAQYFYIVDCTAKDLLFTPLCAICSSLCIIGFSHKINHCAPLEFIGKNSLFFLCVHLFQINTLSIYFKKLYEYFHVQYYILPRIICETTFAIVFGNVLIHIFSYSKKETRSICTDRDNTIDILRAILIILMLIGHTKIDDGLLLFIYSFHMMAFILISGYFYPSNCPTLVTFKRAFKTLIPYAFFGIIYILIHGLPHIKTILFGMSFSRALLTDVPSVGPVYFILLLFIVKIIYIFLDKIKNNYLKVVSILLLLTMGLWLGYIDIWLPWSFDVALVSILFYHIGHIIRKYNILSKCVSLPAVYFPLSCVWAYMIHSGSMELAIRRYGNIGLTIIGIISAFIIIYLLCHYLNNYMPTYLLRFICLIGKSTAYILVLHTLFSGYITNYIATIFDFPSESFLLLVTTIACQITIGSICCYITSKTMCFFKRFLHNNI